MTRRLMNGAHLSGASARGPLRALWVPLLLGALFSGCKAQRTLRITSSPAGAQVWVDDVPRGETPLDLEFFHYGRRKVTFRREGFGTATMRVDVTPPWYAKFPMDIVSEVLIPIGWRDSHSVHAVMRPGADEVATPILRSVLDRAEALRRAGPRGPGDLPPVIEAQPGEAADDEPR